MTNLLYLVGLESSWTIAVFQFLYLLDDEHLKVAILERLSEKRRLKHMFNKKRAFSKKISLIEASEMIDIVKLGLSAGLSFDAALDAYCLQQNTKLSQLFGKAYMSWTIGTSTRKDALMQAAEESGIKELNAFVIAVIQAIEFGSPVVDVLDQQSIQMRRAYKASIESKIEQAPIKILIPTATLVLPALLIAIMGPLAASHSFF